MTDDELPVPDAVCDGGDLDCGSGLLLIIRSAMEPLAAGRVLEVRSRELSVKEDLPAWCRMVGHALLATADDGRQQRYLLRKKHDDQALAADLQRAREHVWQVRSRWDGGMRAKVSARNHGFVVGQPASFDTDDEAPSALELLLGAIAGALTTGLSWRLSRQGIEVRHLEVVARGSLRDVLVFLEVASGGDPGLDKVDVTVYVDGDLDQEQLDDALRATVARCPVTQSLLRTVPVAFLAKVT